MEEPVHRHKQKISLSRSPPRTERFRVETLASRWSQSFPETGVEAEMCGLVALYGYRRGAPPVDRHELLTIRDAMTARGPDDAGIWIDPHGHVGLGHRRLSIIDLTVQGRQPMATNNGRFRIVFNGEIYNFKELRRSLEQLGHVFVSNSDTEVLLQLYEHHRQDMVLYLRGMYALAIWDDERQGLFLARDPFGIKPLYYADDGQTVRVASQVKALRAGRRAGDGLSAAAAVGFFLLGYVPEPDTIDQGIHALPAGSSLWCDEKGLAGPFFYFSIRDALMEAEANHSKGNHEAAKDELRAALQDSITHHMVADVPVGIFLSSGLDSTTLTALATEERQEGLRTLTLGFREYRGTAGDEVPLAEEVAGLYATDHKTTWLKQDEFVSDMEHLLLAMDQPTVDGVNTFFVSKVAAASGLKVAISGQGGDELLGSYSSYRQVPALARALSPFGTLPPLGRAFRRFSYGVLSRVTSPKYAGLFEYGHDIAGAYLLRRGLYMPWELDQVLDPDLVRQGLEDLRLRARLGEENRGLRTPYAQIAAIEFAWYLRSQLLRQSDWAGMAHSLEIRLPLVDKILFSQIAPLVVAGSVGKRDLGLTPIKPLPRRVLTQRKQGFRVPVREWLLQATLCRSEKGSSTQRGLRDWAKYVFAEYQRASSPA